VLDIQTEQHEQGQPYLDLYEAVADLKRRHDLHPCSVRPRDGLALRRDSEREVVQDLVKRFRDLPAEQRRRLPALLNSLAQLEIVVGDIEAGQHDFQEVARLVADPLSRAEAHHNVYRAALERRDWDEALAALRRAAALDAEAFEPFPLERYEPVRILGAGGFGVTFLCEEQPSGRKVAVKALRPDSLDRDVGTVFREMSWLQELDHPALLRVHACAGAGAEETRPYLVLEYFEGQTLTEHVARHGPLPPEEWLAVAWQVARALQAAHDRGVLHRSLRPACVLARRDKASGKAWRVKVVDTGLSLKRAVVHASASNPGARVQTALGRSVVRTIAYAAPEVVARPKGQVWVGPHSDVYSFGRLCAFALTGRPDPDGGDLVILPDEWRQLLDACLGWTIAARPQHFGVVLDQLARLPGARAVIDRVERDLHEATIADHTATLLAEPGNTAALINRGNAHARQGDFEQAVADFTRALELQPEDASILRRRGLVHYRAQNLDAAIADFTEALRLEPRNVEAHANRGLAYSQRNEHDKAIADYSEALLVSPRDEVLFYNRGNAHYCRGEYDRAIADYSEVIRLNPRHTWAFGNRGKAHALRGDHAKAVADYTRVVQLDPNNVKALCDRARAQRDLDRHDKAVADFTAALKLEPSAALYIDRGLAQASCDNLEEAVNDFTEAMALDPNNAAAFLYRGTARHDRGEFEAALADLTEAVRLGPDSAAAYSRRGNTQAQLGRHAEALADYTRALQLKPGDADFLNSRGNVHAALSATDEAIADYTAALKSDPKCQPALANRGNCFVALGDYARAIADFSAALELDPADAQTLCSRGRIFSHLGEHDKALADFTEAIRLEPTARTYYHRGNAHAERGDPEGAIADYTEAIRLEPGSAATYFNRGNSYAELSQLDLAVADFTEAIRLEPNHAGALNNRGNAHQRLGDFEKALADYTASIAADPNYSLPYLNRGNMHSDRAELERALADFGEVIRLVPDDLSGYHNRGRVYAQLGDYGRALADNLEALRRAPDDARTCNNLAWLWATSPQPEQRDVTRAVEFARKACEGSGWKEPSCLDTLAVALAAAGDFEEAARWQRRAVELIRPEEKADYEARLALYEAGKPYQANVQPRIDEPGA
jgi:tetratricopeptide (TPR) repeat protein